MNKRTSRLCRLVVALAVGVVAGTGYAGRAEAADSGKCTFFTAADAERALHGPVVYVPSPIDPKNCAWALAKDSSVGVTVSREPRTDWSLQKPGPYVSQIHRVKGVGQDAQTYYANSGAGGVYTADVLTAKGVTSVSLPDRAGNAATALGIARSMMNR